LWRSSKRDGLQHSINLVARICSQSVQQSTTPITMADTEDRTPTDTKAEAPQATTADQTAPPPADDIEAAVDVDTEMQTDGSHTMDNSSNAKSANANMMDDASDEPSTVPQIETRMPAKKDVALRDFLSKMDEYAPIVSQLPPPVALRVLHSGTLSLTLMIRFQMQSQTTTSLSPVCPHHQQPHPIWRVSWHSLLKSSLPTLQQTHTNTRASDPPTLHLTTL
jgi:hypothetical protein